MQAAPLKFVTPDRDKNAFFVTLKKRVDAYFKENNISKHANGAMVFKTVCMLALFFVPYAVIMSNTGNVWIAMLMFVLMGFGTAGIGFSVMHDSVHGAYSANPVINRILGNSMNVIGGSMFTWKIQHNVLHHTYTNISHHDDDIAPRYALRFSPHDDWHKIHRFQHIYALPLYGLMTLSWVALKDFTQLMDYKAKGLVAQIKGNYTWEMVVMAFTKAFYFFYIVALPMIFTDLTWWQILIGLVVMHYIAGFIMATVFQLAHVVEEAEFPLPNDEGVVENAWAIHQMETTADFAQKSKLVSWFVGGLNFQVEHHLFPNICHIHYPAIAKIARETAAEFGVAYNAQKTVLSAVRSHLRMLYRLGHAGPQMA